jgi:hypothetical protein
VLTTAPVHGPKLQRRVLIFTTGWTLAALLREESIFSSRTDGHSSSAPDDTQQAPETQQNYPSIRHLLPPCVSSLSFSADPREATCDTTSGSYWLGKSWYGANDQARKKCSTASPRGSTIQSLVNEEPYFGFSSTRPRSAITPCQVKHSCCTMVQSV